MLLFRNDRYCTHNQSYSRRYLSFQEEPKKKISNCIRHFMYPDIFDNYALRQSTVSAKHDL